MKQHLLLFIAFIMAATATAQWQQGSGLNGGQVHCLAVKDTILFAGTDTGGVFISTDNGLNWTASNNGLTEKNVVGLVVKGNTIVASIGNGMGSGNFYISTDNGANWVPATNQYYGFVFTMLQNGNDILAGTWFGVARSVNDGQSWTTLSTGLPSNASVRALATNAAGIYAGVASSSVGGTGVFLSTDNGNSWNAKNTGLGNTVIYSLSNFNGKMYAGTDGGGLFASADNGNNWSLSSTGINNYFIKSQHAGGAHLYAGTNDGVFISSDGANWKHINANLPANTVVWSIMTKGNYVYIGTEETNVWRRSLSEVNTGVITLPQPALADIYPNPSNGKFTVTLDQPGAKISVMNVLGETVYTSGAVENNIAVVDLTSVNSQPGVYFVRTETGNGISATQKIIVE